MIIQNYPNNLKYNIKKTNSNSRINFQGMKPLNFESLFDDFYHIPPIDDKDIAKLFPGKMNIAKDFLNLEGYSISFINELKNKKKTEFKYLYDIASKKDLTEALRIPAHKISAFAAIRHEKLKELEPIILSKRDIGIWNYTPDYILEISKLNEKQLNIFIELAKCNVVPHTTQAITKNPNLNWEKIVQKAKALKELYGKDLREIEFYSNSKGENFFLVDIQLPHNKNKPDWLNFKRITVQLDKNINPITKNKLNSHIEKYIDSIYKKISNKLQIFTISDLNNAINEVMHKCKDATEEEIIVTIKKLTQFSSYKSMQNIGEKLKEQEVTEFANLGELYKYFNYFQKRRNLFTLNNSVNKKIGIIFTKKDATNEELMKKLKINKDNPILKNALFINLEGFSDGINLFNDNNKLSELTVNILNEAKIFQLKNKNSTFEECVSSILNNQIENPLKKLGLNVYTLKTDTPCTKSTIIEQMSPIIPTKEAIQAAIESIAEKYSFDKYDYNRQSKSIAKYYDANVNIYSKQSIIEDLKKINNKIKTYMKENNLPYENLYVIENILEKPKSYEIINKMYKELFNIPDNKFIKLTEIADINSLPENSTFLILDDIAGTGQSMIEIGEYYKEAPYISKKQHIIFAPISATKNGINFIQKHISDASRENCDNIIVLEENIAKNYHHENIFNNLIKRLYPTKFQNITQKGQGNQAICTAFPYMSPDNNSYISSILVRLFLPSEKCIKNLPNDFKQIEENSIYYNIFGQKKNNLKLNSYNEKTPSLLKRITNFFFDK